jgi:hypothetical protein
MVYTSDMFSNGKLRLDLNTGFNVKSVGTVDNTLNNLALLQDRDPSAFLQLARDAERGHWSGSNGDVLNECGLLKDQQGKLLSDIWDDEVWQIVIASTFVNGNLAGIQSPYAHAGQAKSHTSGAIVSDPDQLKK